MGNVILHGSMPYKVILVHGGPGANGGLEAIADALKQRFGVIEAIQTKFSIDSQIEELASLIKQYAEIPVVLIGHSWGAWLIILLSAKYPELTYKLILVGSGPFQCSYAKSITPTRISRLTDEDKQAIEKIQEKMATLPNEAKDKLFMEYASYLCMNDNYNPLEEKFQDKGFNFEIHTKVWGEASALRESGKLISKLLQVKCKIIAIHGDWDPHPWEGVYFPLFETDLDYEFYLLENCGHDPWREKEAKDEFFRILEVVITS